MSLQSLMSREVVRNGPSGKIPARRSSMSSHVTTCREGQDLRAAVETMLKNRIGRVPVLRSKSLAAPEK